LISPRLQQVAQAEVGDRLGAWIDSVPTEFEVVGMVDHFPTMYEQEEAGFLVASHPLLLQHLNRARFESTHPNELFLATGPKGSSREALEAGVRALEAETIRKAIKSDPLALGLRSVTLFGYLLTSVLSLAGFGTHFYQSVRQRTVHYGILRAMGLAPRQLYLSLLLEQVLLVVSGLGLGTVLGLLLNQLTLPGLPLSLGGWPAVPPFRAQTDRRAVGTIWLTLSLAFLVSLSIATGLLWHTKLHQTLRVDEE
jgi:putative ABC transport system permease protein